MRHLPVAIIGGGPIGLAAAAHLLERGEKTILFEAGETVGANVRDWGHVRMFSPWGFNIDAACRRLLESAGWDAPPPEALPTGAELYQRYLRPLATVPAMRDIIRTETRVIAISRRHRDKMKDEGRGETPLVLRVASADGRESSIEARAVIDASGTWRNANPMGADGLPALGENQLRDRIAYGIPDIQNGMRERYHGKRVLVVGSGHSAINAILDLLRLSQEAPNTAVLWAMRGTNLRRVFGGGENDALPARGQLGSAIKQAVDRGAVEILAPFRIAQVEDRGAGFRIGGELDDAHHSLTADEVIVCAGARPSLEMLRELRLDLDPSLESSRALAPLIDPNLHSCGTVEPHGEAELRQPEQHVYIVGMKSYGRAPTFLLATGYEQVRSVAAALAGDWTAARELRLSLPETGVCVSDYTLNGPCCIPAPHDKEACCEPRGIALIDIPLLAAEPHSGP